ncbi:hypothetical protein GCM10023148_08790 [Actinokineospora soli]
MEVDSVLSTVTLAERGRRRVWPVRVGRGAVSPGGWTFVLGEVEVGVGVGRRGLLLAAHVLSDEGGGLEGAGAHRWAALVHDSASVSGGLVVPADALEALLAAVPAGTSVSIR